LAALELKERLPDLLHEQQAKVRRFGALCKKVRGCFLSSRGLCFLGGTCQQAQTNYNHCAEIFPFELQAG
jgi:hypothetical protein